MGASRPQPPQCFLVLDYLFSSARKLQFYVELAQFLNTKRVLLQKDVVNLHLLVESATVDFYSILLIMIGYKPSECPLFIVNLCEKSPILTLKNLSSITTITLLSHLLSLYNLLYI